MRQLLDSVYTVRLFLCDKLGILIIDLGTLRDHGPCRVSHLSGEDDGTAHVCITLQISRVLTYHRYPCGHVFCAAHVGLRTCALCRRDTRGPGSVPFAFREVIRLLNSAVDSLVVAASAIDVEELPRG